MMINDKNFHTIFLHYRNLCLNMKRTIVETVVVLILYFLSHINLLTNDEKKMFLHLNK